MEVACSPSPGVEALYALLCSLNSVKVVPAPGSIESASKRRESCKKSTRWKMASSDDQAGSNFYVPAIHLPAKIFVFIMGWRKTTKLLEFFLGDHFWYELQERKHKIFLKSVRKSEHQQWSGSTEALQDTPSARLCVCLQQCGLHWYSWTQPPHFPAGAGNAISCHGYWSCL